MDSLINYTNIHIEHGVIDFLLETQNIQNYYISELIFVKFFFNYFKSFLGIYST